MPEKILEKNKLRPPVVVAEIDFSSVLKEVLPIREYQPISQFPPVLRDIAVIVDEDVLCGALIDVIENEGESIIETIEVFDIYSGKGIPDGKKSIAFSLKFQHRERTLTDEEVDEVIKSILKSLGKEFSAELRGK
jgi:phenylalanyl-tRNA synthetase beta chain